MTLLLLLLSGAALFVTGTLVGTRDPLPRIPAVLCVAGTLFWLAAVGYAVLQFFIVAAGLSMAADGGLFLVDHRQRRRPAHPPTRRPQVGDEVTTLRFTADLLAEPLRGQVTSIEDGYATVLLPDGAWQRELLAGLWDPTSSRRDGHAAIHEMRRRMSEAEAERRTGQLRSRLVDVTDRQYGSVPAANTRPLREAYLRQRLRAVLAELDALSLGGFCDGEDFRVPTQARALLAEAERLKTLLQDLTLSALEVGPSQDPRERLRDVGRELDDLRTSSAARGVGQRDRDRDRVRVLLAEADALRRSLRNSTTVVYDHAFQVWPARPVTDRPVLWIGPRAPTSGMMINDLFVGDE